MDLHACEVAFYFGWPIRKPGQPTAAYGLLTGEVIGRIENRQYPQL